MATGTPDWMLPFAPALELDGDGFEIETMLNVRALRSGVRMAEVPSFDAERLHGVSNLTTFRHGWRVLKTIMREWVRLQRWIGPLNPPIARLDELPRPVILPEMSQVGHRVDLQFEPAYAGRPAPESQPEWLQ